MSIPHILLGLLSAPSSGYDMRKECEQSLSFFWSMNLSQIYPALQKLEEAGQVKSDLVESEKGPARRVYRRTRKGTKALVDWLCDGPRVELERRHYLVQVFFLNALNDKEKSLAFFHELRHEMTRRRDYVESLIPVWKEEHGKNYPDNLPDKDFYPHLTFELGLEIYKTYQRWCDRCIKRIEERPA